MKRSLLSRITHLVYNIAVPYISFPLQKVFIMNRVEDQNQSQPEETAQNDTQEELSKLASCQQELIDMKAKYARLGADFENFKKRLEKDQTTAYGQMQKSFFLPLLEIVDSFDLALSETNVSDKSIAAHLAGFSLIRRNLQKMLEKFHVTEMKNEKIFDPNLHEAVMSVQAPEKESGEIVNVLQKGYLLNGQLLRAAKVTIVA
ncbi:MAG: heat shock protein GrpE [Candidatus Dependentiae bacterium ADurb.Bin331]|nr:MAG: heat shock protein GrpE [Candidatus Dependentiae bacterium ADurb.Bin331]